MKIAEPVKLIGVIDIGTNTVKLLIGYTKNGKVIRIASERYVTGLGKGISETTTLDIINIKKTMEYLKKLKATCESYNVNNIVAVGTSALREALNRDFFVSSFRELMGSELEIISGQREAELTLKGIIPSLQFTINTPNNLLLIDIGGGSTEWISYVFDERDDDSDFQQVIDEGRFRMGSIPIGALRLCEKFIKNDPPTIAELNRLKSYVFEMVMNEFKEYSLKNSHIIIATGGTATTLAAIEIGLENYNGELIHLHRITLDAIRSIFEKLISLPLSGRYSIKGLERDKADIIIPGVLILLTIMEIVGCNAIIISDYGLLEGLLLEHAS